MPTPLTTQETNVLLRAQNGAPVGEAHPAQYRPSAKEEVFLQEEHVPVPVLDQRRSSNEVTNRLSKEQLRSFLRAVWRDDDNGRGFPRAGGLDHAALVLLIENVDGIEPGAYYVRDARTLQRVELGSFPEALQMKICSYVGLGWEAPPAVSILVLSEWGVITSRYSGSALVTGLIDAGAVLAVMQVAATSLGLPSTPCAAIAPAALARMLKTPVESISHVATFLLGGPAQSGRSATLPVTLAPR